MDTDRIEPKGSNFELALVDSAIAVFGDENSATFKPCVRISPFGGDGSGMTFRTPSSKSIAPVLDKGVIGWDDPANNIGVRFYEHADKGRWERGAIEHEVILYAKPSSPDIPFAIELSGLELFFQPALTELEISRGAWRPEEMIGGFCAYHQTQGGLLAGPVNAQNYKTGKAFDLPRPTAKDANEKWIWGSWKYQPEFAMLTAVFDPAWLAKAAYPVIIGPTFGYTSIGGSITQTGSADLLDATSYGGTPASSGTVDSISAYCRIHMQFGTCKYKGVIFPDSTHAFLPNGITSPSNDVGASFAWVDSVFASPPNVTGGAVYYVGQVASDNIDLVYDAGAGVEEWFDASNSYSSPTDPTDGGGYAFRVSYYGTYTESGGGGSTSRLKDIIGGGMIPHARA